ncbi:hypothetical protein BBJ28_00010027 [Nothophytophthora sp. Chile5]|nr:hypothetical protein BBJ28_00010027 [Nothophytophthora sp. Chile5]
MRKRTSATHHQAGIAAVAAAPIDSKGLKMMKKLESSRKKAQKRSVAIWGLTIASTMAGVLLLVAMWLGGSEILVAAVSDEAKIASFLTWFRGEGGTFSSSIDVKSFPGMGKVMHFSGIVALEDVDENAELLFVPRNLNVTLVHVKSRRCRDTITQEWSSQPKLNKKLASLKDDQEELLTAFLLLEQIKGDASRWFPYLQLLPSFSSRNSAMSPLLFASDDDVDMLQDERMIKASKRERKLVKQAYRRFQRLFSSFLPPTTAKNAVDEAQYAWMCFLVNSRAFSIRGKRVLVPFGDIFNGEPHHEARLYDNGQRFLQFHTLEADGMTIRADRSTLRGRQLFEDYGDNSNYVYFLHHGFLMRDGGFDCAAFRLPSLFEAHQHDEEDILAVKKQILSRLRVEDAPLSCISRAGEVHDPELLRIYLMLYNMDTQQTAACNEAETFVQCFPLSGQTQQEERAFVRRAIRQQLEKYPTSFQEDQRILEQGSDLNASTSHAVAFRLSRKLLLRDAQAKLEQQQTEGEPAIVENDLEPADSGTAADKMSKFQRWIEGHDFPVNHLELRYVSEAVGYGTFTTKDLATDEVYLSIPTTVVMNAKSAMQSPWVGQTVRQLRESSASGPRSSPDEMLLLLHLLEEKFGPSRLRSRWKPYLDMLPSLNDDGSSNLGSPLFYEAGGEQLELLLDTDLLQLVVNYRQRVAESYAFLSRELQRSEHREALKWLTERRFQWANAMLDSRSIWWGGQRHLVPLLDMVNCQELDPNHAPHHTNLDSSGLHAVTKASWEFPVGEEVVENYAQPNYIYLLYHGFALASNSHDCAHFRLKLRPSKSQHELIAVLRDLEVYSWTPDVCVSPGASEAVTRFVKLALVAANPDVAVRQFEGNAASTATSAEAIKAALQLVSTRLLPLEDNSKAATAEAGGNFRTHTIRLYRRQQQQHLVALRDALLALQQQI